MATLVVRTETGEQRFPVEPPGSLVLGRAEDADIPVLHRSVSRHHARIEWTGDDATLVDLGSRNGTWVNEVRVSDRRGLRGGDGVRLGEVRMRWDEAGAAGPVLISETRGSIEVDSLQSLLLEAGETGSATRVRGDASRVAEKLQVLLQVTRTLGSPERVDVVLERILELAFQVFDIDRAALLLYDERGELVPRLCRPASDGRAFWSTTIIGHVERHKTAVLFAHTQGDARVAAARSVMIERIKASMAVPLRGRDDDLGVLYVDNRSVPDRFRQEDLDFLAAFANHAAAAIENARLLARLEREAELRNSLLRFFPPATAGELLAGGLPTVETEVTALFCDISGYTPLAASLRPFEVIGLLNSYFPIVAEIVFRHGGMLEKYIGDAILAVWGVPRRGPEDADRALAAAIDMQRALAERNAHLPEGQPPLHVHIGLNSGPVAAGNIGSDAYVQYATIGDATNTAARVCGAAAADEILLSESTWLRLSHRPRAQVRDGVPLKGKGGTARLFLVGW